MPTCAIARKIEPMRNAGVIEFQNWTQEQQQRVKIAFDVWQHRSNSGSPFADQAYRAFATIVNEVRVEHGQGRPRATTDEGWWSREVGDGRGLDWTILTQPLMSKVAVLLWGVPFAVAAGMALSIPLHSRPVKWMFKTAIRGAIYATVFRPMWKAMDRR